MSLSFSVDSIPQIAEKPPGAEDSSMDYFRSCLSRENTVRWLRAKKDEGRKIIGLICWSVPVEIVLAAGGIPVRLSGIGENQSLSARRLPRDVCPLVASSFVGAEILSEEGLLDSVIMPATCDWKRKLGDLLGQTIRVLTLPGAFSGHQKSVGADLRNLARELALVTDLPVTARSLRSVSALMGKAEETFASLQRLRQEPACSLSATDAMMINQALMRDDIPRWITHSQTLVRQLKKRSLMAADQPSETPRLVLVGSPPVWKEGNLLSIIEEAGARIVCDDFHSHLSFLYAPETSSIQTAAGFSNLAARWARTCFCSLVGGKDQNLIFPAIDDSKADGIISHSYRSCARLQMSMSAFLHRASERGIPVLPLETEGDASESGRLLNRIEPFLEVVLAGKRRKI